MITADSPATLLCSVCHEPAPLTTQRLREVSGNGKRSGEYRCRRCTQLVAAERKRLSLCSEGYDLLQQQRDGLLERVKELEAEITAKRSLYDSMSPAIDPDSNEI